MKTKSAWHRCLSYEAARFSMLICAPAVRLTRRAALGLSTRLNHCIPDNRLARAFLFPGQGSQSVGMGRALADSFAAAREVFEEIDDALEQKLSRLMWDGPDAELMLTENAQPAIMAVVEH